MEADVSPELTELPEGTEAAKKNIQNNGIWQVCLSYDYAACGVNAMHKQCTSAQCFNANKSQVNIIDLSVVT